MFSVLIFSIPFLTDEQMSGLIFSMFFASLSYPQSVHSSCSSRKKKKKKIDQTGKTKAKQKMTGISKRLLPSSVPLGTINQFYLVERNSFLLKISSCFQYHMFSRLGYPFASAKGPIIGSKTSGSYSWPHILLCEGLLKVVISFTRNCLG